MGFGGHAVNPAPFQTCLWVFLQIKAFFGTVDQPLLELLQNLEFRGKFKKYQFSQGPKAPPPPMSHVISQLALDISSHVYNPIKLCLFSHQHRNIESPGAGSDTQTFKKAVSQYPVGKTAPPI